MKIELRPIKVRDLCANYQDLSVSEEGITGYGGRLNIRPKYQREFVYDDKKRNAVMETVWNGFPLNVMYWVKLPALQADTDPNGGMDGVPIAYELLDGQQRTISICSFIAGEYMMNFDGNLLGFDNMTPAQKNRILDYELQVYICEGTDEEKLRWFQTINIAGEKLTEQEIRNAIYTGSMDNTSQTPLLEDGLCSVQNRLGLPNRLAYTAGLFRDGIAVDRRYAGYVYYRVYGTPPKRQQCR